MTSQSQCHCKTQFINPLESGNHVTGSIEPKQLTDLPLELYDGIFKFLPLNDLANMSLTCRMYKLLTESFFQRNHQKEKLEIGCSDKTVRFITTQDTRYLIRFRFLIRSILVIFESEDLVTKTFLFIKENCASDLHTLELDSQRISNKVNDTHIEIILDQLQHLEVFYTKNIDVDIVMRHSKAINTISVCMDRHNKYGKYSLQRTGWMLKTETSLFVYGCLDNPVFLSDFLRMNPQLNVIYAKENWSIIDSLRSTVNALQYAALEIVFHESSILSSLAKLKNRKSIKSLDLMLPVDHYLDNDIHAATLQSAFDIKFADGVHFVVTPESVSTFTWETMGIQSHIKRLCITFQIKLTVNVFEQMANTFPNSNCLWITSTKDCESSMKELMLPLITRSRKLEKIYFHSINGSLISNEDAIELNFARSAFQNASIIEIITDGCEPSKLSSVEMNPIKYARCLLCEKTTPDADLIRYVNGMATVQCE